VARHPALGAPVVRAAYAAAARAHAGQARKSGEPVICHCLATAEILAELGLPEEALAAALLHDVLSDTRVTAWQLEEHVPRSCVELVRPLARAGSFGARPERALAAGWRGPRPLRAARPAERAPKRAAPPPPNPTTPRSRR
jgi:(p)ppGpp synthase/HD superfamily hydrolase